MIVYGIDIGVYRTGVMRQIRRSATSFAWVRVDSSPGAFDVVYTQQQNQMQLTNGCTYTYGQDINDLCQHVVADIGHDRVAIGMEAPMWFPIFSAADAQSASFALFSTRFAQEHGLGWWMQSGAAAKVKAMSIGYTVLNYVCSNAPQSQNIPFSLDISDWQTGGILLYEGFVGGNYKLSTTNADVFDAFTSAAAFWGLHGGGTPVSCTAKTPSRLPAQFHAAKTQAGEVFSVWSAIVNRIGLSNTGNVALDCEVVGFQ